jgi:hypothetical protein
MSVDACNNPTVLADLGHMDLIPRHIIINARTEKEVQLIDTVKIIQDFPKPMLKEETFSNNTRETSPSRIVTRELVALVYSRFAKIHCFSLYNSNPNSKPFDALNPINPGSGGAESRTACSSQGAAW